MGVTDEYGYTQQYNISKGRYTNMKRTIKTTITVTIKVITTLAFIMISAYLFETIKVNAAEPTPESKSESIIDMNQISDFVVNGECLQLYFNDGNGYYWENDTDSDNEIISNEYMQCCDVNYVDMNTVTSFDVAEYGLMLYFSDGNGYYWER